MNKLHKISKRLKAKLKTAPTRAKVPVFVLLFAVAGSILFLLVRASGPSVGLETERGRLAGNAVVGSSAQASGGSYVKFNPTPVGVNKARPFASNSPWNTPIPGSPIDLTHSTQPIWYDTSVLHVWPSGTSDTFRHWFPQELYGITWSSPSNPTWTMNIPGFDATMFPFDYHRKQLPDGVMHHVTFKAPATLVARPFDDKVFTVADPVTGDYVEAWNVFVDNAHRTVCPAVRQPDPQHPIIQTVCPSNDPDNASWATGNMITGTGVGDVNTNIGAGVRTSNFSWAAGQITRFDVDSGKIDHALSIILPPSVLKGGWGNEGCMPGRHDIGDLSGPFYLPGTGGNGSWPTGTIAIGSRIGIPASTNMPIGLSSLGIMVFNAFKNYGGYVGDGGGGQWPIIATDWTSFGYANNVDHPPIDSTVFMPVFGFWGAPGNSSDMEKIGPLLRVSDHQPVVGTMPHC